MRYGDDFIILARTRANLAHIRQQAILFLKNFLGLEINPKNDVILKVRYGIKFLGVEIHPTGRRLRAKTRKRIKTKLNHKNIASYYGLVKQHDIKKIPYFNWLIAKSYD